MRFTILAAIAVISTCLSEAAPAEKCLAGPCRPRLEYAPKPSKACVDKCSAAATPNRAQCQSDCENGAAHAKAQKRKLLKATQPSAPEGLKP